MRSQTADHLAEALGGAADLLLIEAPAGYGKTFHAVSAATRAAGGLRRGQEALLLSHTNAARDELARRASAPRVRSQTFDSLACQIVEMYAPHLGIPQPVRPNAVHLGQPSFEEIRALACQLLEEAPAVARGLAFRHPFVVADEYQDSTAAHHQLLLAIANAGAVRVRLFADRLQAIFDFAGALIDWSGLCQDHGALSLAHGHRWDDTPALRDWLAKARRALLAGEPINLADRPHEIHVHRWNGRAPGPGQKGHCPECLTLLRKLAPRGKVAYLVRNRAHAHSLAVCLPSVARLHEAGEAEDSIDRLERAIAGTGDPAALALLLADTLRDWGTGIDIQLRRQLAEICRPNGIVVGKKKRIAALARICELVYTTPDVHGFLSAFRLALERRADLHWTPVKRDSTYLLAGIPAGADDPRLAVQALAHARRGASGPRAKFMTVHKAKGREYDAVVLPYLSETCFPANEEGARLLYVALTRATRELHLLFPSEEPSPLFAGLES